MQAPGNDERPSAVFRAAAGDPARDSLVRSAWRSWLSALATDAEAAMAAALAYESLPPEARDAWLDVLDTDRSMLDVPAVALYAPLLAVEADGARRERIAAAIAEEAALNAASAAASLVLRGVAESGIHACIIVAPLYLDFVQVLSCQYTPSGGFVAARHDPLRHANDLPPMVDVDGVAVEQTPLRIVVEELAHAILADKRAGRDSPGELASFVHLFAPDFEDTGDGDRAV